MVWKSSPESSRNDPIATPNLPSGTFPGTKDITNLHPSVPRDYLRVTRPLLAADAPPDRALVIAGFGGRFATGSVGHLVNKWLLAAGIRQTGCYFRIVQKSSDKLRSAK